MRVIAGAFKGRNLRAPEGSHTRPTTDRVKESLMSTLISAYGSLEGTCVLDAFAGSGALGIECLSRGAARAVFFENDAAAAAVLEANLAQLKLQSGRAVVRRADVVSQRRLMGAQPFDVVLLDPPYALSVDEVYAFVRAMRDEGRLAEGAVVSYEHASDVDAAAALQALDPAIDVVADKYFGRTKTGFVVFDFSREP